MSRVVYPQLFEIVGATGFDGVPNELIVGGVKLYKRLLVEPIIKDEDRDCEVVDEETDTVYVVPEWMIPDIIEKIEYQRMTKDWKKTIEYDSIQQETLRILELTLYKQGEEETAELLKSQRLEKKQPEVYDYKTLYDKAMEKIDKDMLRQEIRRIKLIYKLRGEILPQDIMNIL